MWDESSWYWREVDWSSPRPTADLIGLDGVKADATGAMEETSARLLIGLIFIVALCRSCCLDCFGCLLFALSYFVRQEDRLSQNRERPRGAMCCAIKSWHDLVENCIHCLRSNC